MNPTTIFALFCGLPLLVMAVIAIAISIWGIKTLLKIVFWPIRTIGKLIGKMFSRPTAPVATATVAPATQSEDSSHSGAVTVSQNVTVNSGNGGLAVAMVAIVAIVALALAAGLFFYRPAAAPAPAATAAPAVATVVPASTTAPVSVNQNVTVIVNGASGQPALPVVNGQLPTLVVPVAGTCPTGIFLGANPKLTIQFTPGTWYHVNMSVKGNAAGIENNVLINPKTPFTMVFDGNVYSYATLPAADCQLFVETTGDSWHKVSMLPDTMVEYAFPIGISGTEGGEIIFSVNGTTFTPAAGIKNGVVVQGEKVSGTCLKSAYCGLYWWVNGKPETVVVFQANTDVLVSGFNGTLVQWDHIPTTAEIGKTVSTLAEAQAAGVVFQGDFQVK